MFLTLAPFILIAALLSSSLADSITAEIHDGGAFPICVSRTRLIPSQQHTLRHAIEIDYIVPSSTLVTAPLRVPFVATLYAPPSLLLRQ